MASLKKLAGQTIWYGFSNIAARLLTLLLTPYFTYIALSGSASAQVEFGKFNIIYAYFGIMNVLYSYGMETAFFRYSTTEDKQKLYNTQISAMLISTIFFSALLYIFRVPIAAFTNLSDHMEYLGWCAAIIGLDALSALPYARLRKENRPRKYAATKVAGIVVFVATIVFLYSVAGGWVKDHPGTFFARWYANHWGLGFILFANILQSAVTLLLLFKELADYRFKIDPAILKKVLIYGFPILIAGFAGNINDSLNRIMFEKLHRGSHTESIRLVGVYAAMVRLGVLITLFVQAFKMAAEPFFFSISKEKNAPDTYARIMKWFVILLCCMFLFVTLYIDAWKYYVGPEFREAFALAPVLLLSNVFLGIYYNLTVWYKLTDKTNYAAYIMLVGAFVTISFNWLFIPVIGYAACAWGTLLCYTVMMVLSYVWGQKYYPIPYATRRMLVYILIMLVFYLLHAALSRYTANVLVHYTTATILLVMYVLYVLKKEGKELQSLPHIGKYFR